MNSMNYRVHTIEEARLLPTDELPRMLGKKRVFNYSSLGKTIMRVQLDKEAYWYLSVFFLTDSGQLEKYSLDYEDACDSHYEFKNEMAVRSALGAEALDDQYIDEIMMQYIQHYSPWRLLDAIEPYITAQFHYD